MTTTDEVAPAGDVDSGRADVRAALRRLGAVGAFGDDGEDPTTALLAAVRLVREVAAVSLATAFSAWSQRMVVEYLRAAPLPDDGLAAALRTGAVTGATALAPAIADLAGTGTLSVTATRDGAGWRLTGTIGWASNLFDDAVVVTPARTADEGRLVVLFRRTDPGVTPDAPYDLLGLNGTGTGGLHLHGVAVGPERVLTDDLAAFLGTCRPAMLLMQTALALGLADAALAAVDTHLVPGALLRRDAEDLSDRRDDVARRAEDLAGDRVGLAPGELARLRLAAMDVAAEAVRLECSLAGGAGYRAGSDTARRVREAAFLPVQAPTVTQLRREITAAGMRQ